MTERQDAESGTTQGATEGRSQTSKASIADGPEWMHDKEFLLRAGQELLVSLGVDSSWVDRLPGLEGPIEQLQELQGEVDAEHGRLGSDGDPADNDRNEGEAPSIDEYSPQQRQRLNALIDEILPIVLPVARQTMDRLDERGIRPEIAGGSAPALRAALQDVESLYESGSWRTANGETLDGYLRWFTDEHSALGVEAVPPTRTEIRTIVTVVRGMPRATVRRIAKFRGRLYLGIVVRILLRLLRHESAQGTAEETTGASQYVASQHGTPQHQSQE